MRTRLLLSVLLSFSPAEAGSSWSLSRKSGASTFVFLLLSFVFFNLSSQTPQGFNYQAIATDAGHPITTPVTVRITIQSDSITPLTTFWVEEHSSVTPNESGLFTLVIGKGTRKSGTAANFSDIDWSVTPKFILTEINYGGWKTMGSSRLWTVPYSMIAGDIGGTIDKLKVKGTTASLDSALFEVKNNNGQIIFAVYNEGVRIYVDDGAKGAKGGFAIGGFGTEKGVTSQKYLFVSADSIRAYIGPQSAKTSKGGFAIGGFNSTKEITNEEYLRVTRDSTRVYINDTPAKTAKGGFAIGGFGQSKGFSRYLNVTPDSTRIFTGDTLKGFGVGNISSGIAANYLKLSPINYFIGHEAGKKTTTGKYNSFVGYQAGYFNTTGDKNYFLGYRAGYHNIDGYSNVYIGDSCGYANTSGYWNTASGYKAMNANISGWNNTAIGVFSLYKNTSGNYNTAIGLDACYDNIGGQSNVAIGYNALLLNDWGNNNTAVGMMAYSSGKFTNSTAIGYYSAITTNNQVVLGNNAVTSFYCQGAYAATSASVANMVVLSTGQILRSTSSKRYKKDIRDININTEDIYKLRPVSYVSLTDNKPYFGLVAEEVAEVIPELTEFAVEKEVVPGSNSDKLIPEAVKYPMLSVLLLSEMQKHNEKIIEMLVHIRELENENSEMKTQLSKLNKLQSDLEKLQSEIESLKK
jgi:hypothetical protein